MSKERSPRALCSTTIGTSGMLAILSTTLRLSTTIATNRLSRELAMAVRREVDVEASPEEVWEALATEEGRERWLGETDREIEIAHEEEPHRLPRWGGGGGGAAPRGEGRDGGLGETDGEIEIAHEEEPHRLVWWWGAEGEPATRVEFLIVAAPSGTRVVVSESVPRLPLAMLAASFMLVAA